MKDMNLSRSFYEGLLGQEVNIDSEPEIIQHKPWLLLESVQLCRIQQSKGISGVALTSGMVQEALRR